MVPTISSEHLPDGKTRKTASLMIYSVRDPQFDSPEPAQCKALAIFQLPAFTRKVNWVHLLSHSGPPPYPQFYPQSSTPKPFYLDPLRRVFTLSMNISCPRKTFTGRSQYNEKSYTIFVHSDAFVKLLGEDVIQSGRVPSTQYYPKVFRWDTWSKYARWAELRVASGWGEYIPSRSYIPLH